MNKEDIEKIIDKVIESYFEKRMLADALFWKEAIKLLKEKLREEKQRKK